LSVTAHKSISAQQKFAGVGVFTLADVDFLVHLHTSFSKVDSVECSSYRTAKGGAGQTSRLQRFGRGPRAPNP
ncbi:MAG: hypothetical protein ACE5MK_10025, partial [Acidobacteriota bacterium]